MRKPIFIHIFFLLIAFVVYIQGITAQGPDLIWNMILALIAYDAAVLTTMFKKQKWLYPLLLAVWLAFYPNTFYMLTDLVHMTWILCGTLLACAYLWLLCRAFYLAFTAGLKAGIFCASAGSGLGGWICLRLRLCLIYRV